MKLAKIKGSLTCFSTIYSGTHRKLIPCFLVEDNCPVPNEDPTKYHISVPLGPEDDKRKPASPPSTLLGMSISCGRNEKRSIFA